MSLTSLPGVIVLCSSGIQASHSAAASSAG
jgi:hypothetical protein